MTKLEMKSEYKFDVMDFEADGIILPDNYKFDVYIKVITHGGTMGINFMHFESAFLDKTDLCNDIKTIPFQRKHRQYFRNHIWEELMAKSNDPTTPRGEWLYLDATAE